MGWAILYIIIASAAISVLFLSFPEAVVSLFNSDTDFVSQAAGWISVVAIGYVSMSAVQVFTQAFNTSGATLAPMIVTLATVWAVEIPLAVSLANLTPLSELGVPWAMVTAMTIRFAAFGWYYSRSHWLRTGST